MGLHQVDHGEGESMSYVGKWRIIETSAWDIDYLDASEDAYVEFTY